MKKEKRTIITIKTYSAELSEKILNFVDTLSDAEKQNIQIVESSETSWIHSEKSILKD